MAEAARTLRTVDAVIDVVAAGLVHSPAAFLSFLCGMEREGCPKLAVT
jgi:hypothetical protein